MDLPTHLILYNLAASILIYGSLAYNPRLWLHRMPPEVLNKVHEKTPQERKTFLVVAIPFLLLLFGYPAIYVIQNKADFLANFLTLCAFFVGFALWDTLVLDLLIFCTFTPSFVIVKGTKREDYSNMNYHIRSGTKGLLMSLVFSGILALILLLL
jgi:hypothetical protein